MRYAVACTCAWLLTACHGKYDIHNYAENLAEAACAKAYACCTTAEVTASAQANYAHDVGSCEGKTADALDYKEKQIRKGIEAGRLTYDSAMLKVCLDNYAALGCEALKSRLTQAADSCSAYLVPLVQDGGACALDEECVSGDCYIPDENNGTGTCQTFAGPGDPCNAATCGPGSYCFGTTCAVAKADGEACTGNYQCDTGGCNGYDQDTGQQGTCGPKGGEGTTCFLTKGCSAGEPSIFAALFTALLVWRRRRCPADPTSRG